MADRLTKLERVAHQAGRLLDAINEFLPDDPSAISDHAQALDDALAGLEPPDWEPVYPSSVLISEWRCTRCRLQVGSFRKPDGPCPMCVADGFPKGV